MATLNVTVSEGLQDFLREEAAAKGFSDPADFAQAVLNDLWRTEVRAKLSTEIESRLDAIDRGEYVLDKELIDQIRANLLKRFGTATSP
jgi:hypothetical protein